MKIYRGKKFFLSPVSFLIWEDLHQCNFFKKPFPGQLLQ